MNKTKIPWADYTINPVKGLCPMACSYCYARAMYKRFKWNPEIRFEPETLLDLETVPQGSRVFIGSTIELFHDVMRPDWLDFIFWACEKRADITCIFLTKQPQNLPTWSPFPSNCWILVSATDHLQYITGLKYLRQIEATVRGFSFEPLLHKIDTSYDTLDWVIIGSQTQPTKHPPRENVNLILESCQDSLTPVFVKEPMASYYAIFREELPDELSHRVSIPTTR